MATKRIESGHLEGVYLTPKMSEFCCATLHRAKETGFENILLPVMPFLAPTTQSSPWPLSTGHLAGVQ